MPSNTGKAPVLTGSLLAGSFDFRWPGGDCWKVYRGDQQAGSHCGARKLALQAGRYRVEGSSPVFEPFEIEVRPNETTTAGANAGSFDFRWPGGDCWKILRGEVAVSSNCGAAKQTLQPGRYTLKASSAIFHPLQIIVKANEVTTTDAAAGLFEFNWPGSDCWKIFRGDDKVASGCGKGRQALQQGTYIVKSSKNAFAPFEIRIANGEQISAP